MSTVDQADGYARSVLVAVSLSIAGLLAAEFVTIPAFLLDPTLLESPGEASNASIFLLMTLNFLGFFLVGGLYLWWTERGWEWLDLRMPSRRGWKYVLAGVVGSIAFVMAVNVVATLFELPSSENQVMQLIGDDPNMVLLMIVIVFLFNAPAEEFLFRNVIQKRLYAAFSRMGAVIVTSVIFALVHIPAYALATDGSLAPLGAIGVSLAVVFGGSVIFGYLYARTDNLIVPTAAHAAFNAFQFAILYLVLQFAPEELENMMAVSVEFLTTLA
ncbi:CPBP family intramembrane glutamic endopeptidase [Natronococcus occultus]|uniref:Putative metal-dependent membrane protease n=1 Tax=Natronococcus occultus SP4 TaxID=694430 RepID=L0K4Y4_9EURY|nr:type II CAAX endopeptidase family protein [Natronococcus occultus]AGB39620.1 putative metal-dependent membrane protease [Natronococcus occultus SP4]